MFDDFHLDRPVPDLPRAPSLKIRRGGIRVGVDPEHVHELLFGPVYYRLLLSGNARDREFAPRIVMKSIHGSTRA